MPDEREQEEREQEEARSRHDDALRHLETLRSDLRKEMSRIITLYYKVPSDLAFEREDRGHIRADLRRLQTWIDQTIGRLQ